MQNEINDVTLPLHRSSLSDNNFYIEHNTFHGVYGRRVVLSYLPQALQTILVDRVDFYKASNILGDDFKIK